MSSKNELNMNSLERIYELKELFLDRLINGSPSTAIHLNQAMSNRLLPKTDDQDRINLDMNHLEIS